MADEEKSVNICLYAICGDNERLEDVVRWGKCAEEADCALVIFTGESNVVFRWLLDMQRTNLKLVTVVKRHFDVFRFDKARNASIEAAEEIYPEADVFFTIDMDEGLPEGWADLIRSKWKPGVHQRISYSHRHFEVAIPAGRNWGHARGWRWKYPCHEVMIRKRDGQIWYKHDECLFLEDELEVIHYRDPDKPRSSYLPLLEMRWGEYKDEASIAYLVREYYYNAKWQEILDLAPDIRQYCKTIGTESCMAYTILGAAYEAVGDKEKAGESYEKAVKRGPTLRRGYIERGRWLIDNGRAIEAYELLLDGLEKTSYSPHGIFVDSSDMWTWRYEDWLCVAAYWADMPLDACAHALEALRAEPHNAHIWDNLEKSFQLLTRSDDYGPRNR